VVVVVAVAGVTTVGEDINQQKAAADAVKMADVVAAEAEVELAVTATAAAAAEAVAVAAAEMAATVAAIAMAMSEGLEGGIEGGRRSLGFHVYNLVTIWCKVGRCF
jgi:hypothetical protein